MTQPSRRSAEALIAPDRSASARALGVPPFLALDVMAEAKARRAAGEQVCHLEVGQPSGPAPRAACEATARLLATGEVGYTEALGRPSLRARIARRYAEVYGVAVPPERIVVTTGSSGGFTLAFLAAFAPGARVAIPSPGYPAYRAILLALGLEPVELATGPSSRWTMTAEMVAAAHAETPLAGALAMSPANPTGVVTAPGDLADLAATCRRLGIWLVSDEIYHGLTYEAPAATALAFDDDAIIVNSFSKYFAMTGWRIGWLVAPERLVRPIERLAQNLVISSPTLSQAGAEAALDDLETPEAYRAAYAANRALLLEGLPRLGFDEILPVDGAFYAYANVARFTNDSSAFAKALLAEAGVAITPGIDFDQARGRAYVRLSFAGSEAEVAEALDRMARWLPKR
ncbi:pyridoxal phosphate-dependent aminotransferase [Methylopila turkensis]|uniref:Aminotransferase n=1 Tax=Methylopila turkensis TaxID=1437816 RepID=A0A9W6JS84_9HYPH|nr:aminotransferase class I/II-fold pyridoxal phosphate-dependent enzyme [Methylopila turkensis]GLK80633.1 1-aminocyclopropane-1-carboxylate deaminase [Methylopila turkensis]